MSLSYFILLLFLRISITIIFNSGDYLTYELSRKLFLRASSDPNIKQLSLEVGPNLFIDTTLVLNSPEELIIHISGTHGPEGHIGSKIQREFLNGLNNTGGPSILFVHALNPFGFKYNRRVNENNVDLNRNAIFKNNQRNEETYRRFNNVTMPTLSGNILYDIPYVVGSIAYTYINEYIEGHGSIRFKREVLNGVYPDGIFYNGNGELQKSHVLLRDYIIYLKWRYFNGLKRLTIVDVHTGLGSGSTLLISKGTNVNTGFLKNLPNTVVSEYNSGTSEGYEEVTGEITENYGMLFDCPEKLLITQEFGTYNNLVIIVGLIVENVYWHTDRNSNSLLLGIFNPKLDYILGMDLLKKITN
jgi:hypothetical protein